MVHFRRMSLRRRSSPQRAGLALAPPVVCESSAANDQQTRRTLQTHKMGANDAHDHASVLRRVLCETSGALYRRHQHHQNCFGNPSPLGEMSSTAGVPLLCLKCVCVWCLFGSAVAPLFLVAPRRAFGNNDNLVYIHAANPQAKRHKTGERRG